MTTTRMTVGNWLGRCGVTLAICLGGCGGGGEVRDPAVETPTSVVQSPPPAEPETVAPTVEAAPSEAPAPEAAPAAAPEAAPSATPEPTPATH